MTANVNESRALRLCRKTLTRTIAAVLGAGLLAVAFAAVGAPKDPSGQETVAIKNTVALLADAFNHHDASAWADLFAEDGDFNSQQVFWAHGRKAIELFIAPLFSGALRNAAAAYAVRNIRMLSPSLAEVDVVTTTVINPGAPPVHGLTSLVLGKQKRVWVILVFHE